MTLAEQQQSLNSSQGSSFSKVGHNQGQGQKLQYQVKGLVIRNTHMQNESSITSGLKVMAKVSFSKVGQTSRSMSKIIVPWERPCHKE